MLIIRRLVWDDWNIGHIARHYVIPREIEQARHSHFLTYQSYKGRYILVGATRAGRILTIVIEAISGEEGAYYPITAFDARPEDQQLYQRSYKQRKGVKNHEHNQ
jgi:hypothetical protein